jgi:hypothetical protein
VLGLGSEEENGCADRRRIACVMVGWKRPPYGEYFVRCIGSVWPNEKNAEEALSQAQYFFMRRIKEWFYVLVLKT